MIIADLRKRVTVSTTPRIEMSVSDVAALLDVADAAKNYAFNRHGVIEAFQKLRAALVELEKS